MNQLPVAVLAELPELPVLLDAHLGSLQLLSGGLQEAAHTLARGAAASGVPDECAARADCEGQLALLEAFRGNLRRAVVHADLLAVAVADDGIGGADDQGAGLRGLADRVEALDGRLTLDSPAGGGTRLRAEIPHGLAVRAR